MFDCAGRVTAFNHMTSLFHCWSSHTSDHWSLFGQWRKMIGCTARRWAGLTVAQWTRTNMDSDTRPNPTCGCRQRRLGWTESLSRQLPRLLGPTNKKTTWCSAETQNHRKQPANRTRQQLSVAFIIVKNCFLHWSLSLYLSSFKIDADWMMF